MIYLKIYFFTINRSQSGRDQLNEWLHIVLRAEGNLGRGVIYSSR